MSAGYLPAMLRPKFFPQRRIFSPLYAAELMKNQNSVFNLPASAQVLPPAPAPFALPVHASGAKRDESEQVGQASNGVKYYTGFIASAKYPSGKKVFRCSQCRYVTDRKNNLKRHISTMHQDCGKTLECCDVIFKSKASLREHVVLYHRSGYKCRFCARNFCRKALLKRHLAVHNGQKDFICSICDYATSHKSNLDRHRKVVHGCGLYPYDGEGFQDDGIDGEVQPELVENTIIQTTQHDQYNLFYMLQDPVGLFHPELRERAYQRSKGILAERIKHTHNSCSTSPNDGNLAKSRIPKNESLNLWVGGGNTRRLCTLPYKCSSCGLCVGAQATLMQHTAQCSARGKLALHAPLTREQRIGKSVDASDVGESSQNMTDKEAKIANNPADALIRNSAGFYASLNRSILTERDQVYEDHNDGSESETSDESDIDVDGDYDLTDSFSTKSSSLMTSPEGGAEFALPLKKRSVNNMAK